MGQPGRCVIRTGIVQRRPGLLLASASASPTRRIASWSDVSRAPAPTAFGWSPEHRLRALTQRRLPNPAESGGLQAKPNIRHPHASSARTPSAPAARTTSRTIRRRHPPPRPTRGPYPRVLPSRRLKRDTNNGALHAPGAATKSSSAGSTSTASPTPSSPKVTSTGTYSRSRTSSSSPNAADSSSEAARVSQASPNANAFAERWIPALRSDCLDQILILGRRHLEHALRVYRIHYNRRLRTARWISGRTAVATRRRRPWQLASTAATC